MSQHVEVPLRPPQQPWPGLGTRIGFLDPGAGFLDDGSVNVMINRGDILQKRKGFVRGLDEMFNGVVCGLFRYTSNCGIESLIVADQGGIHIRNPFAIPVFENSDAYPFDNFAEDGPPSSYFWRNVERYSALDDELFMRAGVAETADPIAAADFLRWFKQATNLSYQVRVEYRMDPDIGTEQQIAVLIKGNDDLSSGSYILGQVIYGTGTYVASLHHFDGTTLTELESEGLIGDTETSPGGFLTVSYERDVTIPRYRPRITVIPTGGNQMSLFADLNAVQDAGFGQTSAIAIGHNGGVQPAPSVLVVDGGPL